MANRREFRVRGIIPGNSAGHIIGRGGSNVRHLQRNNNVRVKIIGDQTYEKVIEIRADEPWQCANAVSEVIPHICGPVRDPRSHLVSLMVLMPDVLVGKLIGKRGHKINRFRSLYGACVKVNTTNLPTSSERLVIVSGTRVQICRTVEHMLVNNFYSQPDTDVSLYIPDQNQVGRIGLHDRKVFKQARLEARGFRFSDMAGPMPLEDIGQDRMARIQTWTANNALVFGNTPGNRGFAGRGFGGYALGSSNTSGNIGFDGRGVGWQGGQ